MDTFEHVRQIAAGIGIVKLVERPQGGRLIELQLPDSDVHPDWVDLPLVTLDPRRASNDAIVRLEMFVAEFEGHIDPVRLDVALQRLNVRSVFGRAVVKPRSSSPDLVVLEHNVMASTLTPAILQRIVLDMARLHWKASRVYQHVSDTMEPPDPTDLTTGVFSQLEDLVGLQGVKQQMREFAALQRMRTMRDVRDLKSPQQSLNMVFTGNPGTGKTTVARLLGGMYQELGLLSSGHVVETERSQLCGGYIGQTAIRTLKVCESALDGVLFIDEAYTLFSESHNDYGREAIATLMTFMEKHRGRLAVVVAGYSAEMAHFLDMNPGLRSRFDRILHFPDYSTDEMLEVLRRMVREHDYDIDRAALDRARLVIDSWPRGRAFGNARAVRSLFDRIVCNHAMAIARLERPGTKDLRSISVAEMPPAPPVLATVEEPLTVPMPEPEPTNWYGYL